MDSELEETTPGSSTTENQSASGVEETIENSATAIKLESEGFISKLNHYYNNNNNNFKVVVNDTEQKFNTSVSCILKEIAFAVINFKEVVTGYNEFIKDISLNKDDIRIILGLNSSGNMDKINKYLDARKKTKRLLENGQTNDKAVSFLSRLKASQTLDTIIAKGYREGTTIAVEGTEIKKEFTYETLTLYQSGKLKHYIEGNLKYEQISTGTWELPTNDTVKKILRDQLGEDDINNDPTVNSLQIKSFVDLVFGTEIKRNPAALLTNAMFMDLCSSKTYKVHDFQEKVPMAMELAVAGSTFIDHKAGFPLFDFRVDEDYYSTGPAFSLVERDNQILLDWLCMKQKFIKDSEDIKIQAIVKGSALKDLIGNSWTVVMDNSTGNHHTAIFPKIDFKNINSYFKIGNAYGLVKCNNQTLLNWLCEKSEDISIQANVKPSVFSDFIYEWYGIEIPELTSAKPIEIHFTNFLQ